MKRETCGQNLDQRQRGAEKERRGTVVCGRWLLVRVCGQGSLRFIWSGASIGQELDFRRGVAEDGCGVAGVVCGAGAGVWVCVAPGGGGKAFRQRRSERRQRAL